MLRLPPLAAFAVVAIVTVAAAQPGAQRPAFEGYQPFTDEKVIPWKQANDAVGRIGGWRAYAREAQGAASQPPASAGPAAGAPASAARPASAPAKAADPHAGHH